jgi:hypothetical protein
VAWRKGFICRKPIIIGTGAQTELLAADGRPVRSSVCGERLAGPFVLHGALHLFATQRSMRSQLMLAAVATVPRFLVESDVRTAVCLLLLATETKAFTGGQCRGFCQNIVLKSGP